MKKRSVTIGSYKTAAHGWTVTGITLGDAEQKTNYVEKPGGDGSWDLSTVMTDDIPRYKNRPLTVTLECSEGDRDTRERLISEMVNQLDGLTWKIVLPDRPRHYLQGRVMVTVNQNSVAYAALTVTATCEPWFYNDRETVVELIAEDTVQTYIFRNSGRRAVIPEIVVDGSIVLTYNAESVAMGTGTYTWPSLLLTPGIHTLEYSGSGTLTVTYREAVLR